MPLGWFVSLSEANEYFEDERLVTTSWDALTDDALKSKAVTNGYNRIYYDPRYAVPTYAAATAAQLIVLKKVNGEMAYYLAQHLEDEDRRKGIQAQAVTDAGIVEESYDKDKLGDLPVPPFIDAMLEDAGFTTAVSLGIIDVDRDEDESVNEKIDDF